MRLRLALAALLLAAPAAAYELPADLQERVDGLIGVKIRHHKIGGE